MTSHNQQIHVPAEELMREFQEAGLESHIQSDGSVWVGPSRQAEVGRDDGWTGEPVAVIYEIDLEHAIYTFLGPKRFNKWCREWPSELDRMKSHIADELRGNLVIDAKLDEYVRHETENWPHKF